MTHKIWRGFHATLFITIRDRSENETNVTDQPLAHHRSVLFCQRRVIFVSLVLMLLITVVYYGTTFR